MKDTVRNRIGRILTGTANTIVTKIEGLAPEVILEQAVREVDSAIDEAKVELGRFKVQKHHVSKAMLKLNTENDELEDQLVLAQEQGRDDLLEAGISRQLDIEDQLPALQNQMEDLSHRHDELERAITGLLAKRNEMEDELFEFKRNQAAAVAQAQEVGAAAGSAPGGNAQRKAERADRAFSQVIQNATGVRRESLRSSSAEAEQLLELSKLNKKARIESRLRELRARGQERD